VALDVLLSPEGEEELQLPLTATTEDSPATSAASEARDPPPPLSPPPTTPSDGLPVQLPEHPRVSAAPIAHATSMHRVEAEDTSVTAAAPTVSPTHMLA
jgi:hypothetical protein